MEGPAGDEQDVVRADVAVLGCDGAPLYDGQQITLNALEMETAATPARHEIRPCCVTEISLRA